MEQIVVTGGRVLNGSVEVCGAKNAVLKHLVAMLLAPGVHELENVPGIADVEIMSRVLEHIGATCHRDGTSLAGRDPRGTPP